MIQWTRTSRLSMQISLSRTLEAITSQCGALRHATYILNPTPCWPKVTGIVWRCEVKLVETNDERREMWLCRVCPQCTDVSQVEGNSSVKAGAETADVAGMLQ